MGIVLLLSSQSTAHMNGGDLELFSERLIDVMGIILFRTGIEIVLVELRSRKWKRGMNRQ
jgi:hypothetical protein